MLTKNSVFLPYWLRLRCLASIIIAFTYVSFAMPAPAAAKQGYEVHNGGIDLILPVESKANRVISISANQRQRVKFVVEGPSSTTIYSTKGRVSGKRVVADFGSLGRLSVNLRFMQRAYDPPHKGRCVGRGTLYKEGVYRGRLEFSHSGDIPAVFSTQGRVYFERRFRQVCKRQRRQSRRSGMGSPKRKVEVGFLTLYGKAGSRTVSLEAFGLALKRNPARLVGRLTVTVYERGYRVQIARLVSVPLDKDSFAMSARGKLPEVVEVEPPAPFEGSALYSRHPGISPSWSGNLTVRLVAESIPLTGSDFSVVFCRSSMITRVEYCPFGRTLALASILTSHPSSQLGPLG